MGFEKKKNQFYKERSGGMQLIELTELETKISNWKGS